jgi:hypothetical protein
MADRLIGLLRDLADGGSGVTVLSPHLDDAVLSCGALLGYLARRHRITVISVFTAAAPPPWSLPARRALRALGTGDAEELFQRRRAEDLEVLGGLGATPVHLGFTDALFRVRSGLGRVWGGFGARPAYRTFRFDAARGRVAGCDAGLAAQVAEKVRGSGKVRGPEGVLGSDEANGSGGVDGVDGFGVVLAPLGIGRHVDHLITRAAAGHLGLRTVYYSDFPYSRNAGPDPCFVRRAGLVPHPWLLGREENARRIAGYRTQFAGLFPEGRVPIWPEYYWIAATDSATSA